MTKVKLFSEVTNFGVDREFGLGTEHNINNWLAEHPNIDVVDIKINNYCGNNGGYYGNDTRIAMVIYKTGDDADA